MCNIQVRRAVHELASLVSQPVRKLIEPIPVFTYSRNQLFICIGKKNVALSKSPSQLNWQHLNLSITGDFVTEGST